MRERLGALVFFTDVAADISHKTASSLSSSSEVELIM
jgi:hypothetical protein